MAFTDPKQDTDVSTQLYHESLVEAGFTGVWHKVLREACGKAGAGGQPPLVLDVGANFGYYSLFAAAMGCRVMAWEPVPYFAAYFKYGLLANNFTGLVEVGRC
jgi:predicted RNA methylase